MFVLWLVFGLLRHLRNGVIFVFGDYVQSSTVVFLFRVEHLTTKKIDIK
jgi:hypothetical protein